MASLLVRILTLILLAVFASLLAVDIQEHGSFKASRTRKFLEDSGALHYGGLAWSSFISISQQGFRWCLVNIPVYATKVRENAAPHLQTVWEWLLSVGQQIKVNIKLLYGYFLEKIPIVKQWINQYVPGLTDTVISWLKQAWAFLNEYSTLLLRLLLRNLSLAGQWLMENVFIGSLSPENLQKYTLDALNSTQKLAFQTFNWLNNKVVTSVASS